MIDDSRLRERIEADHREQATRELARVEHLVRAVLGVGVVERVRREHATTGARIDALAEALQRPAP